VGSEIQTTAIKIDNIKKQFGTGDNAVTALTNISIDILDNEFFTLLGPSGCGKTTLLRMIAGLESVTAGTIFLYGQEIKHLPANKRPVNTVFQQYALFPHMTVLQNIGFGLKMMGKSKSQMINRSKRMLELVQLDQFGDRRPSQLSGGQQQRVALARALAPAPKVLLLDEPLSALDLKLRQAMRVELKQIQEETGITFVFVTHDQEEALTMSDRIAVMSNGELQQVGSAQEIYEQPRNQFVAGFIGETNLFDVIIEDIRGDQVICRIGDACILCAATKSTVKGSARQISIRPERLSFTISPEDGHITGVVERLTYLGTDTQYLVQLDDGTRITVRSQNAHESEVDVRPGERIGIKLEKGGARLLMS
jgi:spermidine/putrescine transport system ATP-binding protein